MKISLHHRNVTILTLLLSLFALSFGMQKEEAGVRKEERVALATIDTALFSGYLRDRTCYCVEQLPWAVENNYCHVVEKLYEYAHRNSFISPKHDSNTEFALLKAAELNNSKVVKFFIEKGVDIDAAHSKTKETTLMLAAFNGNYDLVSYLLACGANHEKISQDRKTALVYALLNHKQNIVSLLLAGKKIEGTPKESINKASPNGYSPEKKCKTIFNWLCSKKEYNHFIEDFVKAGAWVNPKDYNNHPLLDAIAYDNPEGVQILLKCNANPNFITTKQISPLKLAVEKGNLETVQQLIVGVSLESEVLEMLVKLRTKDMWLSLLPVELIPLLSKYFSKNVNRNSKNNYIGASIKYAQTLLWKETDNSKKENFKKIIEFLNKWKPKDNLELGWEELGNSNDNIRN